MKLQAFSRRSRAVTAKKCTKKRDARALLLFCQFNLLLLGRSRCRRRRRILRSPTENATAVTKVRADLETSFTNGKIFETRLGGKICSFDVNIHEGYSSL